MRLSAFAIAAIVFVELNLQAAQAGVCIHTREIVSSVPNENTTGILFKMRDGKVWRNDLRGTCPGLKYNGFTWALRNTDLVCDQQESIQVINSGEVCLLGAFKSVTPSSAPH